MGDLVRFPSRPKCHTAGPPSFGVAHAVAPGMPYALQDYGDTVAVMLGSGQELWLSKADALALGEDLAKMARR
jgi:hypothetical protein